MRILVLLTDLFDAIGGIQTFNRCLVKALDEIAEEKGWKVTILVLNDRGNSSLASKYLGLSKYQCSNKNKLLFIFMALFASLKADVVFFGHVNLSPLATFLKIMFHELKMFLMIYGVEVWKKLPFLQALGVKCLHKVISISAESQRQLQLFNKLSEPKIIILPCTLDPFYSSVAIQSNREMLNLPTGKMLLTVSRLDTGCICKNVHQVIESMPLVIKKIPDASYVIVGDGNDKTRLEKLANNLGLSDKVFFTGFISDSLLPHYYNACDLFVLCSSCEGFGIVFLEAMYYAKPCIGALSGAIPEVIEDGKSGFLVELDNKEILACRIVELLINEKLRQAMGEAGKERLEKDFSFDKFKKRLKEILCL